MSYKGRAFTFKETPEQLEKIRKEWKIVPLQQLRDLMAKRALVVAKGNAALAARLIGVKPAFFQYKEWKGIAHGVRTEESNRQKQECD